MYFSGINKRSGWQLQSAPMIWQLAVQCTFQNNQNQYCNVYELLVFLPHFYKKKVLIFVPSATHTGLINDGTIRRRGIRHTLCH